MSRTYPPVATTYMKLWTSMLSSGSSAAIPSRTNLVKVEQRSIGVPIRRRRVVQLIAHSVGAGLDEGRLQEHVAIREAKEGPERQDGPLRGIVGLQQMARSSSAASKPP